MSCHTTSQPKNLVLFIYMVFKANIMIKINVVKHTLYVTNNYIRTTKYKEFNQLIANMIQIK